MYNMQIKLLGLTCRVEIIVISIIVGILMGTHLFCSCATVSAEDVAKEIVNKVGETARKITGAVKEGFIGSAPIGYKNTAYGSYESGAPLQSNAQILETRLGPQVPLPAGQMFFFANNTFSPECCVPPQSGVSNSDGCACVTQEQVNYISSRGGNRAVCGEF